MPVALLVLFITTIAATAVPAAGAGPTCGVLDGPGCASICGVLDGPGCVSEQHNPFSENLQATIITRAASETAPPDGDLNTLTDLFAALRACWRPPAQDQAFPGMQVTVRLAFNRDGQLIGKPLLTFATPAAPPRLRNVYLEAVMQSLQSCTPFAFTKELGGAVAGRPLLVRFIDDRGLRKAEAPP